LLPFLKNYLFTLYTVIDCLNKEVKFITKNTNYSYNSLILNFTISIKTSNLSKTSHYTPYQQKLFKEVKRLKKIEGLGYRKISNWFNVRDIKTPR